MQWPAVSGLRALGPARSRDGTGPGQDRSQRSAETLPAPQHLRRLREREKTTLPLTKDQPLPRPGSAAGLSHWPRPASHPGPRPRPHPHTRQLTHLLILTMADSPPGQSPPQETAAPHWGTASGPTKPSPPWFGCRTQQAAGANAEGHMGHLGGPAGLEGALGQGLCRGTWPAPEGRAPILHSDQFQAGPGGPPGTPLQTSPQSVLSLTWALALSHQVGHHVSSSQELRFPPSARPPPTPSDGLAVLSFISPKRSENISLPCCDHHLFPRNIKILLKS